MNTWDIGDLVTVWVPITVAGVATDATAVAATVRRGDGTTFTASVVRTLSTYPTNVPVAGTGLYYAQFTATVNGPWHVYWVSTGTAQGATEDHFYVRKSFVLSGEFGA